MAVDISGQALEVVLLFDRGRDVIVQRNAFEAASYIEAIDVENDEYAKIYRLDGEVLQAAVDDRGIVRLTTAGLREPDRLKQLLSEYGYGAVPVSDDDLLESVARIWDQQWKMSWPHRPKWLGGHPPPLWGRYGLRAPWVRAEDGVELLSPTGVDSLKFMEGGIAVVHEGGSIAEFVDWGDVLGIDIRLPHSSRSAYYLCEAINVVGAAYGQHSSFSIVVKAQLRRRDAEWELGRPGQYSWRLQLVVSDFLRVLAGRRELTRLSEFSLWEWLRLELAPSVPSLSRSLLYSGFFGLERFMGGSGAYDRQINRRLGLGADSSQPR